MKDKQDEGVIITIGDVPETDVAAVQAPASRATVSASEDAARAAYEGASDIEVKRLRKIEASYADRFVASIRSTIDRIRSHARRARAARSARSTRRAKPKAPSADDGEPEPVVGTLIYADDLEPFVRIMGRIIATNVLNGAT